MDLGGECIQGKNYLEYDGVVGGSECVFCSLQRQLEYHMHF